MEVEEEETSPTLLAFEVVMRADESWLADESTLEKAEATWMETSSSSSNKPPSTSVWAGRGTGAAMEEENGPVRSNLVLALFRLIVGVALAPVIDETTDQREVLLVSIEPSQRGHRVSFAV